MAAHGAAEVFERSHVSLDHRPSGGSSPAGTLPAAVAENLPGVGGQEGVPGPPLAAFQRLEQETVGTAMELGKGGDRGIAVENHLAGHRYHPAPLRSLGEGVEGSGHCGAAAR